MNELDIALERLHLCAFETADGIANCGPMAASALEQLGHAALTSGLMDVYVPRFHVLGEGTCLRDHEWTLARGKIERAEDWLATFAPMLEAMPWPRVLADALRFFVADSSAPPVSPDAWLRLSFAVDALEREEAPIRKRELAFALAFAAAKSPEAVCSGDEPDKDNPWVEQTRSASGDVAAIEDLLGEVCLAGVQHYLANKADRASHTQRVEVPSAFRILLPHLPDDAASELLVAMLSSMGRAVAAQENTQTSDKETDFEVERCAESVTEIRYRAACSVHEHAILMAQACLREDAIQPSPVFRRAAADAALRLSPPGYQEWR